VEGEVKVKAKVEAERLGRGDERLKDSPFRPNIKNLSNKAPEFHDIEGESVIRYSFCGILIFSQGKTPTSLRSDAREVTRSK
jgi:hypothetical protein